VASEAARSCAFETDRLIVGDWHDLAERLGLDLADVITVVLTTTTTSALPPDWYGDYDADRATRWIIDRDAESPTLLAIEKETGNAIGLMILFETALDDGSSEIDLRLGYVLAESAWGNGFATELVNGLVQWARSEPLIRSISGGVAQDNEASAKVLVKNGFAPTHSPDGERLYKRVLRT
jgi:RimJ/RimL family protein N-acetyltransferase